MKRTTTFVLILWLAFLQELAPLLHAHVGDGGAGRAVHTHVLPAADHAGPAQPHADASRHGAVAVIGMADEHRPGDLAVVADAAAALRTASVAGETIPAPPLPVASVRAENPASFAHPWPQAPPACA